MFNLLVAGPLVGVVVAVLAIVVFLRSQLAFGPKAIMVIFAATAFLARPCLLLISYYFVANPFTYNRYAWLLSVSYFVSEVASYLMFLVVAVQITKLVALPVSSCEDVETASSVGNVAGPVWDTKHLSAAVKHSALRRREWAFFLDILPGLVFLLVYANFVGFINVVGNRGGINPVFFSFVALIGLYILVRDSFDGVSVGKRFSGCRVVDYESGQPIGLPQSLLRNILLLVPFLWIVEFVFAVSQKDRRRIGDWIANTIIVKGPPNRIDGVEVVIEATPVADSEFKHPLD